MNAKRFREPAWSRQSNGRGPETNQIKARPSWQMIKRSNRLGDGSLQRIGWNMISAGRPRPNPILPVPSGRHPLWDTTSGPFQIKNSSFAALTSAHSMNFTARICLGTRVKTHLSSIFDLILFQDFLPSSIYAAHCPGRMN
jgi:hypothetical protein